MPKSATFGGDRVAHDGHIGCSARWLPLGAQSHQRAIAPSQPGNRYPRLALQPPKNICKMMSISENPFVVSMPGR
jgi:hypothetical protein